MSEDSEIEYKQNVLVPAAAVADLFRSAELDRPATDMRRMAAMMANANQVITAWDGQRLVGIARALSDGAICCFLCELAVDPDYHGREIEKELLWQLKRAVGPRVAVYIVCAESESPLYRNLELETLDCAFRIPRAE